VAAVLIDKDGNWKDRVAMAAARLSEPADRQCAAEVLAELAEHLGPEVNPYAEPLLAYSHDANPHIRTAVIRFIGDAGQDRYTGWLISRLASRDEDEAAAAAKALLALGPRTVGPLLDALHRDKRAIREAVLGVLSEMPATAQTLRSA